jgi:hypothetical protein
MYYKVVKRNDNGELVSLDIDPAYTDFYRIYQKDNENLKVKNGMAFDNFQNALHFILNIKRFFGPNELEIWSCIGTQINLPRQNFNLYCVSGNVNVPEMIQIMRSVLFHGKKSDRVNPPFPCGQVRLRNLKLKEKVQRYW